MNVILTKLSVLQNVRYLISAQKKSDLKLRIEQQRVGEHPW